MRKLILTAALLLIPSFPAFALLLPIITISRATINYSNNQVTFNGTGFEPSKKSPSVLFAGNPLTVILTLPSECVPLSWLGWGRYSSRRSRRGGVNVGIGFIDFHIYTICFVGRRSYAAASI
jgi:hypothetical protein